MTDARRRKAAGRAAQLGMSQRACRDATAICRQVLAEKPGPSDLEALIQEARAELAQDILAILEPCQ